MAQQQERQRVPVGANQIWVSTAASVYHRTHRERVNEEILANNPDLARRLNNEEDDDLRQLAQNPKKKCIKEHLKKINTINGERCVGKVD